MNKLWIGMAAALAVGVAVAVMCTGRSGQEEPAAAKPSGKVVVVGRRGAGARRPAGVRRIVNRNEAELLPAVKETSASTEESRRMLVDLTGKLESGDEDAVAAAVNAAPALATPELLAFAERALKGSGDAGVRADVIQLLDGVPAKKALRLLAYAAHDGDPYVRAEAVRSLAFAGYLFDAGGDGGGGRAANASSEKQGDDDAEIAFEDGDDEQEAEMTQEQVAAALVAAVNDGDEDVREAALDAVKQLDAELQLQVLEAAVDSKYEDVRADALMLIMGDYNKDTVLLAMEMLDDPNEELQAKAQFFLEHLTDEPMNSQAEAKAWWAQNADRYDYDMVEAMDLEKGDGYAEWH